MEMSDPLLIGILAAGGLSILCYLYWRSLYSSLGASFRAYDVVFLSVIFSLIFGRVSAFFLSVVVRGEAFSWREAVSFIDLNYLYLVSPFAFVLALQFLVFNLGMNVSWWRQAGRAFAYGVGVVFVIELAQLMLALTRSATLEEIVGHILLILIVVISIAVDLYAASKMRLPSVIPAMSLYTVGIVLVEIIGGGGDVAWGEHIAASLLYVGLALFSLLPLLSLARRLNWGRTRKL